MNDRYLAIVYSLSSDILNSDKVLKLKNVMHHKNTTTYQHSINVAYFAVKYAIEHNCLIHMRHLVRVALLHDYYLYDWHKKGKTERWHKPHGYRHPKIAADNARRDFNITDEEYAAIKTHMWPLMFFRPPKTEIGWIITWADKKATFYELFNKEIS